MSWGVVWISYVWKQGSDLIRLYETYTTFIPLQYPLIFPYGEDGYQEDISISDFRKNSQTRTIQHISMREFIEFRIQEITYEFGNILSGGLFLLCLPPASEAVSFGVLVSWIRESTIKKWGCFLFQQVLELCLWIENDLVKFCNFLLPLIL